MSEPPWDRIRAEARRKQTAPLKLTEFLRNTDHLEPEERHSLYDALDAPTKAEMWSEYLPPEQNGARPTPETFDGAEFILDSPVVEPIWGRGDEVLWSQGEPLWIVAGESRGKSTIAQQLALARAGIHEPRFFGYPVEVDSRRVLYVAADRPRQLQRSFKRMVTPAQIEPLKQGLVVVKDFPKPLSVDPESVVPFVDSLGDIGTVFIDSLKDVASDLSKDAEGARVNTALKNLIHSGREVVVIHHDRKEDSNQSERRKPKLPDVYGSRWLTAGAGTVFYVEGEPGRARVTFHNLKPAVNWIPPLDLIHNFTEGETIIDDSDRFAA